MTQVPFSTGDHVFGYGRDSGGEEQDLSVAQQENALRKWCQENGIVLSRFFKDEARKGSSTVGRAELQNMMHEFRRGCSEKGVIVWKYNRFARSVDNAQFMRAEIRTLGYIFHSITDNVPEGPMGRLFEAAIDFKDEQYLIDLSIDVKRGLRDLVELHGCVPGGTPTGFKRVPHQIGTRRDGTPHIAHRWRPDPAFAKRILQAFQLRAARVSLGEIHKQTKLLGGINSYSTFFSNPIYKGLLRFGDYIKEDYCKAMVPPELWEQVQGVQHYYARSKHTSSQGVDHPRRANSRFLLSGLAKHLLCGSPLYGHSSKQKSGHYYDSYFCTRAYRNRDCVKHRIPREIFENAVVKALSEKILQPDYITAVFQDLKETQGGRIEQLASARKEITTELSKVKKQIKNVTDSLADLGTSKSLIERLHELELQETDILSKLSFLDANAEQPVPEIPVEILKAFAGNFQAIYDKSDLPTRRTLLRAIIDHVDVVREGNTLRGAIYFYYPPDIVLTEGAEHGALAETKRPKANGPGDYVPIPRHPSGPPERISPLRRDFFVWIRIISLLPRSWVSHCMGLCESWRLTITLSPQS